MSSNDELHKVLAYAFEDLTAKLKEAEARAEGLIEEREALRLQLVHLDEIRSILAGDDGPEDKIQSIEWLLK